ncbi:MAG TPA: ABC transporter permease [Fimbriimonadaceae bacterium]|nr:ABC transporter permease [Fimbriimonadaceae bacterium]
MKWRGAYTLIGLVAALFLLFGIFAVLLARQDKSGFLSLGNVETILRQSTPVCIAALGMTLVIITAGIDLSIGSVVAFVSVVVAWFLVRGMYPAVAFAAGIVSGAAFGFLNGVLVSRIKVGAFIVTLATMLVARGAATGLANEQKIDAPMSWLNSLLAVLDSDQKWMLLPSGVWVMVILAILTHWILNSTRFGRHAVAVGSNERAALYSGISVDRVKLAVYTLMGIFAGFAGVMMYARLSVGDPSTAEGFELSVIAAVVIGGASLSGGQGSILGSILGALIMATINAGCSQLGMSNWIQQMITGGIIVISVMLDRVRVARIKDR